MSWPLVPKLPLGDHAYYAGIDPGHKGAIALLTGDGKVVNIWDMPITDAATDKAKQIDLVGLNKVFLQLKRRPDTVVGIEWPSTRPGEGAERSERFGRGKGYLHAFAHLMGLEYYLIVPNLWKGRMGLPGKTDPNAIKLCAEVVDRNYPEVEDRIRGPRGGLKDGRIDALLIAHFLRRRSMVGATTIVGRFGKDSPQAAELVLGRGRRKVMKI